MRSHSTDGPSTKGLGGKKPNPAKGLGGKVVDPTQGINGGKPSVTKKKAS